MAKKGNLLRNLLTKKEEASETGWSCGKNILRVDMEFAAQKIREAGLTVYIDNDCIYGPEEESLEVLEIIAGLR